MSRTRILTATAIVGALAVPTMASAQTAAPDASAGAMAFATADLNMRAGPGSSEAVVSVIPSNQPVNIHNCTETMGWCQVSFGGQTGWAYSQYLAVDMGGQRVSVRDAGPQIMTGGQYDAQVTGTVAAQPPAAGAGVATGALGGAATGAIVGGPVGAAVGGVAGATLGGASQSSGTAAGAAGGAVTGALVGGPVGAAVGGVAGAALGTAIQPPQHVEHYVVQQPVQPVTLHGDVAVGAALPANVALHPVPDYDYQFAYVNDTRVLVEPRSRQVVYVID